MTTLFGERLKSARKMAGLSLQQLANQLEGTISKQALNKYEKGSSYPNSQVLIRLSQSLSVPVDFFFHEPEVQIQLSEVAFRKRSKLTKTAETAVLARCENELRRYLELEYRMQEEKQVTPFEFPHLISSPEDAESAAAALRDQWKLGQDPISSVMIMLENNGYKVFEVDAPDTFDGLKARAGQHRLIVVNQHFDTCRRRFTALHELAHHILVFPEDVPEREMERLCHTFAGAVLFPADQVLTSMHAHRFHFYLREMVLLKTYWGISISAMFARAKNLQIISEYTYANLHKQHRAKGYYQNEPGEYSIAEHPHRFQQLLLRGLAEEIISINQGASLSNLTVGELRARLDQLA